MSNLIANYERILEVLKKISNETLLSYQRRLPKLKDLELMSLALTAEFMSIDSENHLFRHLADTIKCKIERTVFNRRKRRLANNINDLRMKIAKNFNEFEEVFIVDSIPVEVCKIFLEAKPRRSVRRLNILTPTEGTAPLSKCIFMVTNLMQFALGAVFSKAWIYALPLFTISII